MILDRFRLTDRVAVVTGAGRGIGAATAVGLAEAGADVLIAARTDEQLRLVAGRIEAAGRRAVVVAADLNDLDAVAALAPAAQDAFGRLDIVINNVGGTMPKGFLETSPRFLEGAFHFNVSTAHALTRAAVPFMLAGDGGAVVNISSAMGRTQGRGFVAYGTAKAALAHYTRLAATDLSTPSPSARSPPRPSRSSSPTRRCGRPWRPRHPWAGSASPRTSPPPSSTCARPPAAT
jgi:7-alpha-hydroxysteroid dehydrogenase